MQALSASDCQGGQINDPNNRLPTAAFNVTASDWSSKDRQLHRPVCDAAETQSGTHCNMFGVFLARTTQHPGKCGAAINWTNYCVLTTKCTQPGPVATKKPQLVRATCLFAWLQLLHTQPDNLPMFNTTTALCWGRASCSTRGWRNTHLFTTSVRHKTIANWHAAMRCLHCHMA